MFRALLYLILATSSPQADALSPAKMLGGFANSCGEN
jgi:hypothetical protein